MSDQAPRIDTRRTADFSAELQERARAWIPAWGLADGHGDFGRALLEIAARFSSEVAERLDGGGDKMRRGFLDWLAVRGEAARPARMPVAFKLADAARTSVLAEAPVRLQADAGGMPVVFETERDVRVVPGRVEVLVAVDPANDAFYLAPAGLTDLEPLESSPTRWQPKNFVAAGATKFQLDPEGGLATGTVIEAAGHQYRVEAVDKDLVTIAPPLDTELLPETVVTKGDRLAPFDGVARNWQSHALYLGDADLLNIEAKASIEIVGAGALRSGVAWQYWGKVDPLDETGWQPLIVAPAEQQKTGSVVLTKPKGAVDIKEIAGRSGRWIRAYRQTSDAVVSAEQFSIRVNGADCGGDKPCPPDEEVASPAAEGMANTTPLVLENVFSPLGREPRQFDAFYLGSKEVFSKPKARVQLCFQMADPRFKALGSLRGGLLSDFLFAGVAADGHLHLLQFEPGVPRLTRFRNRPPLRPPSPDHTGAPAPGSPVTLERAPSFRPAMWIVGTSAAFVAVTAGNSVWLWREDGLLASQSGWRPLGSVVADPTAAAKVSGLVHLAGGTNGHLAALCASKLYLYDLDVAGAAWREVVVKEGPNTIALTQIAPIQVEALNLGAALTEGIVGVSAGGKLYGITLSGATPGSAKKLLDQVAPGITPAAIRRTDNRLIAIAIGTPQPGQRVLGFRSTSAPQSFNLEKPDEARLVWPFEGASIDANVVAGQVTAAFCLAPADGASAIGIWSPLFGTAATVLYRTRISPADGVSNGAPTITAQHILVPTTTSEVIVAPLDGAGRKSLVAPLGTAIVTETAADRLVANDHVAFFDAPPSTLPRLEKITGNGREVRRKVYHELNAPAGDDELFIFKATTPPLIAETLPAANKMKLPAGENVPNGTFLLIRTNQPAPKLYKTVGPTVNRVVTLDRDLEVDTGVLTTVAYQEPDDSDAELLARLILVPAGTGNWNAAILDRTALVFPGADPVFQNAVALDVDADQHPLSVALGEFWSTAPPPLPGGVNFLIDASVGNWSRQLADTSTNPDLSWEYWNGTGWWTLGSVRDNTLNLKRTGAVIFKVPDDLRESDWSGKTNFWIRARLIGGDYGQEKVTVTTKTLADNKTTEQTVQRSSDGIRAPSVLKLHISYALCDATRPALVLSEDSGSVRDQSDANSTAGAVVEAFVPLSVMLRRLSGDAPATSGTTANCPPDCNCGHAAAVKPAAAKPAAASTVPAEAGASVTAAPATGGVALLVGLDAMLSDAPVNMLFLVDERDHAELAPLTVETLIADRFQRVVADDATRALGETGVVSMSFPEPPAVRELFGRPLTWLKLSPRPGATTTVWTPSIRGAYLNAAWASATETLTRELLGSSDGAPFLTFRVARPPVLRDTLELRVREPLGDEDRAELREDDATRVLSDVEGLPGDWVRWDRVTDPGDEPPKARVYALDESIGEVRFGDGLHGMIAPIGRDSIVAFSYKRTEAAPDGSDVVPANGIAARTPLNLVSPVASVEAVVAADQAAGGAPPESVARVVRFGFSRLRHRSRVVTARDLEDITLQSSPDIAQARAIPSRGGVRLIVVMKGRRPQPTAAQVRELRRVLLAAGPVSLATPKALRIAGPVVRPVRIDLRLRVETLDQAGALAKAVKEQLAAFFDTATGGLDGHGWRLGVNPTDEDIALALVDAPYLDGIADIVLRERHEDGGEQPWPPAIRSTEIVMLAADPVRIQFETAEVPA